jgi:hypothetical protein
VTLRVMVVPYGRDFLAECVDLNLMVIRPTAEAAARSLEDAMTGYLETVFEKPDQIEGLYPRPSPLSRRLKYHWHCMLAALSGNKRAFRIREYATSEFAAA